MSVGNYIQHYNIYGSHCPFRSVRAHENRAPKVEEKMPENVEWETRMDMRENRSERFVFSSADRLDKVAHIGCVHSNYYSVAVVTVYRLWASGQ